MKSGKDKAHYQKLRHELVEKIRLKGITDERVLAAIKVIPRHLFVPEEKQELAYIDKAVPIGEQQTISQPYTVAYQTQLLEVHPFDKLLEIGTGSGYQASVLAVMGAEVFTMERRKKLFDRNESFAYLQQFTNIHFFYGDGHNGLPAFAPFDKILITAATDHIPPKLLEQLKPHGYIVAPVGRPDLQEMVRISKNEQGELTKEVFDNFSFVPMLKGKIE
jgi:protein-L-isoaspartate(D-aspartate) O-methyltransferase